MTTIRLGTRGSRLALWQANETARLLEPHGIASEIVVVRTTGDRRQDVPLASIGGKGLFIKELEEALLRGEIDAAVHSLKDVPSIIPQEFELVAFLERGNPHDVWIHRDGARLTEVPAGTKIATSAPRRRAQLRAAYPHLQLHDVRGNVDTRIRRMHEGEYDAVVLAAAGITRLGRSGEITETIGVEIMLPAAGQGIIAIEMLADHIQKDSVAAITHPVTAREALCERAVLQQFGAELDCHSAIGVHAKQRDLMHVAALVSSMDGGQLIRVEKSGEEWLSVAEAVAAELQERGAMELLKERI